VFLLYKRMNIQNITGGAKFFFILFFMLDEVYEMGEKKIKKKK